LGPLHAKPSGTLRSLPSACPGYDVGQVGDVLVKVTGSCIKISTVDGLELLASDNKGVAVPWSHDGTVPAHLVMSGKTCTSAINVLHVKVR
jgi:hypothetical protein